jgi:hypothetical protein
MRDGEALADLVKEELPVYIFFESSVKLALVRATMGYF